MKIYRVLIDENGQENCSDYIDRQDATSAFVKAKRRATVFSAMVTALDDEQHDYSEILLTFERGA